MGNQAYNQKNTKQVKMALNLKTDADIIQHLETVPNTQGYIKQLIRNDIAKEEATMKRYHILPDYLSLWGEYTTTETIITQDEVERLATEWDKPIEELLAELEEI